LAVTNPQKKTHRRILKETKRLAPNETAGGEVAGHAACPALKSKVAQGRARETVRKTEEEGRPDRTVTRKKRLKEPIKA